ncbi:MAG: non-canonical purine NTP pyrophosphatase, partial [Clostridia bacterium]|nr:non-canonical purine NTP pyrophosphatase [Clostridia bacterium]
MKVFIATKNQKKLEELKRILEPMGFEVCTESDFLSNFKEVEETGKTFEENALLKATAGLENTGLMSVADDSGLCVDYLDGA